MTFIGNNIQIGNVVGNVTVNYSPNKAAKEAIHKSEEIIKAARNCKPTDCKKCKFGIMGPSKQVKKRQDGTVVVIQTSKNSVTCGRESVSSMTMIDGKIICSDYVERTDLISDKGEDL